MDKLNIHNYEILVKQQDDFYLAFCPQLNIIFKDNDESNVYKKIKNHIKAYVSDLRDKEKTDKKEKDLIKERAIHDVEEELKENINDAPKDESENQNTSTPNQYFQEQSYSKDEDIDISEFDGSFINEDSMI